MKKNVTLLAITTLLPLLAVASDDPVLNEVIAKQRSALETNTIGKGFGPQSPRDIDTVLGENGTIFNIAL